MIPKIHTSACYINFATMITFSHIHCLKKKQIVFFIGDELSYIPDIFFDFGLMAEDKRIIDTSFDVECSEEESTSVFTFFETEHTSLYVSRLHKYG